MSTIISTSAVKAKSSPSSSRMTPTVTGPPRPLVIMPSPLMKPLKTTQPTAVKKWLFLHLCFAFVSELGIQTVNEIKSIETILSTFAIET